MRAAKLVNDGESQIVRLPKEFQFEGEVVLIKRTGNAVVLLPMRTPWDSLVSSLGQFTSDFMQERGQPSE